MPDRIIRDELLESERWLSLKDNADRLAYIALLLKADSLGNYTAEKFRLMRLWRDFGISTVLLVAKTLSELSDHDLIRIYESDGKDLLHIPRFGQRNTRYIKRTYALSPWTTDEQKQQITKYSHCEHDALTLRSQPKKRRDREEIEKGNEKNKTLPRSAQKTARGTRLLDDWVPPKDWFQWCESERPDLDSTETYNAFHDYWIAKPGKDGLKLDWEATWRNWVRNSKTGVTR